MLPEVFVIRTGEKDKLWLFEQCGEEYRVTMCNSDYEKIYPNEYGVWSPKRIYYYIYEIKSWTIVDVLSGSVDTFDVEIESII